MTEPWRRPCVAMIWVALLLFLPQSSAWTVPSRFLTSISSSRRIGRVLDSRGACIRATARHGHPTINQDDEDNVSADSLMQQAQQLIAERKSTEAFETLAQIYAVHPTAKGLRQLFGSCLRLNLEELLLKNNNDETWHIQVAQERMGLAALLIEQERYDEAAAELRHVVTGLEPFLAQSSLQQGVVQDVYDMAARKLYRSKAALCHWTDIARESQALVSTLDRRRQQTSTASVPALHPFEALKWPCISLADATHLAQQYAQQAALRVGAEMLPPPTIQTTNPICIRRKRHMSKQKIRLGYISPDFSGRHPLSFLMQDVFRQHDLNRYELYIYSLSSDDGSPEVQAIRSSANHWIELVGSTSSSMASRIQANQLDVLVDLCSHAGSSTIMEVLACRVAPVQVSYMGFPASTGAAFVDYLVCDATVVPPHLRSHYTEHLFLMPHSYFVNSHAASVQRKATTVERVQYGLPNEAFVFCCHSRPDKIDPATFRSWCRVLQELQQDSDQTAVLWLLRSGPQMEHNLRSIAQTEFRLPEHALVFADIAPRDEHLQRLALADLFLDTPAYNAHTVGCDAVYAGVPMVTLLRPENHDSTLSPPWVFVPTEKMASRVGASLLKAVGLDELVAPSMQAYEQLMIQAVRSETAATEWKGHLVDTTISQLPLFDTQRWVQNLEVGLQEVVDRSRAGKPPVDMIIEDSN